MAASLAAQTPAVLQIIPYLESGGTARTAVDISYALARAGGGAFIASHGGRLLPEALRSGIHHEMLSVDTDSPWLLLKLAWQLGRLAKREKIGILHARTPAAAWAAITAKRFAEVAVVVTLHDLFTPARLTQRWFADAIRQADHIIAVSSYVADHVKTTLGIPADRLSVIPTGVNLAKFNPAAVKADRLIRLSQKWLLPDGVPVIVMPAALQRHKGHGLLIQALTALKDQAFHGLMLGDDGVNDAYRREIEALIVDNGLEGKVRFGGFCDDMPTAYMLADLVVCPSLTPEAFALTAAEAQAMGRPVVAADHGGAPEIVRDGETGWLFKPNDPGALAGAIKRGLSLSSGERERIALTARSHIERHFPLDTQCARTFEVYRRVSARETAGTADTRRSA